VKAYRISDVSEIDIEWLKPIERVAITSGASTPTTLTKEVIDYVTQFDVADPQTWPIQRTINMAKLLPVVK
jgi:4-hydroxy-3-methylbut-2-enyl diphosphate reductase